MSPDTIKAIAKQIRAAEERSLGFKMSNTTTLNAIVRGLGLADTYSGYLNTLNAPTPGWSSLLIIFPNTHEDTLPCSPQIQKEIEAKAESFGFSAELCQGAHGFSSLYMWQAEDTRSQEELDTIRTEMLAFVQRYVDDEDIEAVTGSLAWKVFEGDQPLVANFMYYDNEQVCSGLLDQNAWKQRSQLNLSDTQAFLILYKDVEISSGYTADDITLQDIMLDVTYYAEA